MCGFKMKHALFGRIQRQDSGQQKEQGQERLSNSSLSMLIFLVLFAQQQETPRH
ncbi:MAG: hypothetical protein ACI936_004188 [Paraglaciecola sp.]|jgi:hypothetical protein